MMIQKKFSFHTSFYVPESAKALLEETGCDGIMIGRAARGNPWIFKQIDDYLSKGILPEPVSKEEIRQTILEHAELMTEYKGEYIAVREMRKHVSWYTTGNVSYAYRFLAQGFHKITFFAWLKKFPASISLGGKHKIYLVFTGISIKVSSPFAAS